MKSYGLAAAIDDFAPAVGPQTVIIPSLNGMSHIDALTKKFGENAVLGGVCYVATEVDSQGRIVQLAGFQSINYGELNGKQTPRIEAVDQFFRGAGFDAAISANIVPDMWEKWVFLASVGSITCLLNGNIGEIVAGSPAARTYLLRRLVNAPQSRAFAAIRYRRNSWRRRARNSLRLIPR